MAVSVTVRPEIRNSLQEVTPLREDYSQLNASSSDPLAFALTGWNRRLMMDLLCLMSLRR
jgi:hypothetical protein